MKYSLSPSFISAVVILFTFLLNRSFAQPPQYRAQVDKVLMNNQMRMQSQMDMARMFNMRSVQTTNQEYDFIVTLRDSITNKVTSAIYTDSTTKKHFIVLVDKKYKKSDTNRYKRIYPAQTLNVTCVLKARDVDNDNPGIYIQGKPTDSCWMFKAINGHLTVYSYLINDGLAPFLPSMITGIQLNDGPILKFNKENLKTMVGQNGRALELITDNQFIRAINRFNRNSEKEGDK